MAGVLEKVTGDRRMWYEIEAAGRVLSVRQKWHGVQAGRGDRGEISEWSMQSRIRCLKWCYSVKWPARMVMVTLTYPGVFEIDLTAKSGIEAKEQLKSWRKRVERRYGKLQTFWKLEFQRRGAPHFHVWMEVPGGESIEGLTRELVDAWCGVVGSTGAAHREHGTMVEPWIGNPGAYVAAYTRRSAAKEHQHRVPEGWEHPGRFWGAWNTEVASESIPVARSDYIPTRRAVAALQKSKGRKAVWRGMSGGFAITDGPAAAVLARMVNGS